MNAADQIARTIPHRVNDMDALELSEEPPCLSATTVGVPHAIIIAHAGKRYNRIKRVQHP
jgi:hypothetical protein